MQYNLPKRINCEEDLKFYEKYLLSDNRTEILTPNTMNDILKNKLGYCVNVRGLNINKTGVILEVGKDFLVLKNSNNNTLIPFSKINYLILPQGN